MTKRASSLGVLLLTVVLLLASCTTADPSDLVVVRVWAHSGTDAEARTLREQVSAFNTSQSSAKVRLRLIPEGDYNDELAVAAARGQLPDVIDVDGPLVPEKVVAGWLAPLDDLLAPSLLDRQLPSLRAQGRYLGATYAVGTFDSGLGLFADRAALTRAGIGVPTTAADAWSGAELTAVLRRLARRDPDGRVLDVKMNYGAGEWLTYGFAPLVSSAGGRLLDTAAPRARGHLDGPATMRVLRQLSAWSVYVDDNADDHAFVDRRVPLSWVGHWVYPDYRDALGDDLAVLPLPDLGRGSKTGQGSWAWAVTTQRPTRHPAATAFLEFLLRDDEILRITRANGAVPGSTSALADSALYAPDGPLRLFAEQLLASCGGRAPDRTCVAVPRPKTPAYSALTQEFAQLVASALRGDVNPEAASESARFVDDELELLSGR